MTSDAEIRDAIRDLCVMVAELALGAIPLVGTDAAGTIINKALDVSRRMDETDD
jgi:hypothetical protein